MCQCAVNSDIRQEIRFGVKLAKMSARVARCCGKKKNIRRQPTNDKRNFTLTSISSSNAKQSKVKQNYLPSQKKEQEKLMLFKQGRFNLWIATWVAMGLLTDHPSLKAIVRVTAFNQCGVI